MHQNLATTVTPGIRPYAWCQRRLLPRARHLTDYIDDPEGDDRHRRHRVDTSTDTLEKGVAIMQYAVHQGSGTLYTTRTPYTRVQEHYTTDVRDAMLRRRVNLMD